MHARALALNVFRVLVVALALAILLVTPLVVESPGGRSYDPIGITVDLAALIVLIAVVGTTFGARLRRGV